ncbi:hypothetical protein ACET3X_007929 [Alternaria dauci]|uniref:Clr5 domain-containing protein n=1 Tax=Alternaria dauci TaxID=48095 RepID=A0ABR3UDD1_9PLEO
MLSASRVLAERIDDGIWEQYRNNIRELYISEDRTLDGHEGVMDIMTKRYGFSPTKSQYQSKLAAWAVRKKITNKEWNTILPRIQERTQRGRQTEVMFNGIRVDEKRIERELDRRRSNSSMCRQFLQEPQTPPGFAIGSPPCSTDTSSDVVMQDVESPSTSSVSDRPGEATLGLNTGQNRPGQQLFQSDVLSHGLEEQTAAKTMKSIWGWWEGNQFLAFPTAHSETYGVENRDPVTFELSQSPYEVQDEAAFLKNYTCCGFVIESLHDLLNHFEATHATSEPKLVHSESLDKYEEAFRRGSPFYRASRHETIAQRIEPEGVQGGAVLIDYSDM